MDNSAKLKGQGARDKLAGKAQKTWGKLTGSKRHQVEGHYKMAKGSLKAKTGRALETLRSKEDEAE